MKTRIFLLLGVIITLSFPVFSQTQYQVANQSTFTIAGTSTLHDWTMETGEASGQAVFLLEDSQLQEIKSLQIVIPTESLKSGKNAMDKNAYQALKSEDHPDIAFNLVGINRLEERNGAIQILCKGDLTIAGITRPQELTVTCTQEQGGMLLCEGAQKLKMSAFEVEPPSFMFGTLTTGDEIEIHFQIAFEQDNKNKINFLQ